MGGFDAFNINFAFGLNQATGAPQIDLIVVIFTAPWATSLELALVRFGIIVQLHAASRFAVLGNSRFTSG